MISERSMWAEPPLVAEWAGGKYKGGPAAIYG